MCVEVFQVKHPFGDLSSVATVNGLVRYPNSFTLRYEDLVWILWIQLCFFMGGQQQRKQKKVPQDNTIIEIMYVLLAERQLDYHQQKTSKNGVLEC